MSDWWRKGVAFPKENENFLRILEFYLLKCPVKFSHKLPQKERIVSNNAKLFDETDWKGNNMKTLLSEMKRNIIYIPLKNSDKVEDYTENLSGNEQFIIFIENNEFGKTQSIFYAIRNSFAHASFSIDNNSGNPIYYMESNKQDKIKSQIKLKEQTLLKWIELFNMSLDDVQKIKKERRNRKAEESRKLKKE